MNRNDSATHRRPLAELPTPAAPLSRCLAIRRLGGRIALQLVCAALILWQCCCLGQVLAQPPGTLPPKDVVRPSGGPSESGKLPIEGILFLDESNVPIYMPPMSYEDYLRLERGQKSQTRRYIFENIAINGRVEGSRAELSVEVKIAVDATGDETIEIPLAMENFHLLGPPEFFSGGEVGNKLAVSVDEDTGSRQLVASIREDTVVGFRMQMSARVEIDSLHQLDFRLPPAPIQIDLLSDSRDVVGQIPNRDAEVTATTTDKTGRTAFRVESSGGRFTLQWGKLDQPVSTPLLESTSTVSMLWNSPQDQLLQDIKMTIRDARAPISGFKLRIPKNSNLRDAPKLITSDQFGQVVNLSNPDPDDDELFQITIPDGEQEQTIALEFRLEIPSESPSAKTPLVFQVPFVEDAIGNRGTINITAGSDYRLRWRQRPYVKNTTSAQTDGTSADQRDYSFQFTRGSFALPMWLDATRTELRVTSECDIELRENYANLAMEIRSVGNSSRAQLLSVDLADWQAPRIENARTGAPLPWYESDDVIEIEVSYTGMEESIPVLIKARRVLDQESQPGNNQQVDLPIPRVVGSGDQRDPVTIQDALIRLTGKGRRSLVVDLERSTNVQRPNASQLSSLLDRAGGGDRESVESPDEDGLARLFAVVPPESPARLVGEMVFQAPRISLQYASNVKLIGNQLITTVDWNLETSVDLEGKLRIAIPQKLVSDPTARTGTDAETTTATDQTGDAGDITGGSDQLTNVSDANLSDADTWSVKVNGSAARLRPAENPTTDLSSGVPADETDDVSPQQIVQYDLISDALGDGQMEVHFVRSETVTFDDENLELRTDVGLPVPVVKDLTLQGNAETELLGGEQHDINPAGKSIADQLVFRTLPTRRIPLRISPRVSEESELLSGKVVVRSAVSEVSQHDQLLANLTGAGEFALQLLYPDRTDIQATLNGNPAAYRIVDDRLVIRIPSDGQEHLVDVRLWVDRTGRNLFQAIEPLAHVGPGTGQLYWQLTVPADCHLVWATPSVGREMTWTFDRWRLIRRPLLNETTLVGRIGAGEPESIDLSGMPSGNRYLFSSNDDRSFRAMAGTKTMLWMIVAGAIVFITAVLTYLPSTRNPLTVVVAVAGFAGLVAVAPDAAVLVGQIAMLALVLVIVMLAIRSIVLPTPSRVLKATRESRPQSSIHSRRKPAEYRPPSSIAVTHSIGPEDVSSTPGEVAS